MRDFFLSTISDFLDFQSDDSSAVCYTAESTGRFLNKKQKIPTAVKFVAKYYFRVYFFRIYPTSPSRCKIINDSI